MSGLRFASFFSGIGGFELGLERAGHRCVWACEIDPFARKVYEARFGRLPAEDVTRVQAEEIPDADLWCGGFPCQDLSTAGKRAGLGEGTRSGLVFRFLWLAAIKQPEWLLLENVPGLLSGRSGGNQESEDGGVGEPAAESSWIGALLGALDNLGYVGAWRTLDARHFGVPQRRRRVFILARRSRDGADPASILLEPEGVRGRAQESGAAREGLARAVTARAAKGVSQREGDDTLIAFHESGPGWWNQNNDHTAALRSEGDRPGRSSNLVANARTLGSGYGQSNDGPLLANVVTASAGHHGRSSPRGDGSDNLIIAGALTSSYPGQPRGGDGGDNLVAATLTSGGHPNSNAPGRHAEDDVNLVPIAFDWTKDSHGHGASEDATHALGAHHTKQDAVAYRTNFVGQTLPTGDVMAPVRATPSVGGEFTQQAAAVRRLTPRECERLQGFPDDWTLIEGASDARRYKAIGNAVAVPVIEWIGRRLASLA